MKYLKGPQNNADPNDRGGYAALQAGAAVVDHAESRILRLAGRDPVGMLNAVLTNDVPAETDRGAYAALLNPKGRVQADLRVIKDPSGEAVFIVTEPEGASAVKEILGRYAPFSRVKLEDLSGWTVLGFYGPDPATIRDAHGLAEHKSAEVEMIDGIKLLTVGVATPVPGFEHIGPAGMTRAVRERLIGAGAAAAGRDACETARIAAGIPRFGADITPDNFPGESERFLERAVSFGKGCYPGQETVARMRYRGSPNKKLYRFELEPGPTQPPEAGDEILQEGKKPAGPIPSVDVVGWLTSVAPFPVDGRLYALGYLARKADLEAPMRAEDAKILSATRA